jgi:hypothetical protein
VGKDFSRSASGAWRGPFWGTIRPGKVSNNDLEGAEGAVRGRRWGGWGCPGGPSPLDAEFCERLDPTTLPRKKTGVNG